MDNELVGVVNDLAVAVKKLTEAIDALESTIRESKEDSS